MHTNCSHYGKILVLLLTSSLTEKLSLLLLFLVLNSEFFFIGNGTLISFRKSYLFYNLHLLQSLVEIINTSIRKNCLMMNIENFKYKRR